MSSINYPGANCTCGSALGSASVSPRPSLSRIYDFAGEKHLWGTCAFRMYICIYGVSSHPRCIFELSQQQTSSSMPRPSPSLEHPQPPLCHISSPGRALDRASHAQEINPAGCRPVTSRAGGQERLPALPEVLMRLEMKSCTGGVPVPAWQTHPRCPPRGCRAESERRGRKITTRSTRFLYKIHKFQIRDNYIQNKGITKRAEFVLFAPV